MKRFGPKIVFTLSANKLVRRDSIQKKNDITAYYVLLYYGQVE